MPDEPKYHAALLPPGYGAKKAGPNGHALLAIKKEFAPIFGSKLVHARHYGEQTLISGDPADTVLDRNKQERYHWTEREDGVLMGTLIVQTEDQS
jgi:hypothetical protein